MSEATRKGVGITNLIVLLYSIFQALYSKGLFDFSVLTARSSSSRIHPNRNRNGEVGSDDENNGQQIEADYVLNEIDVPID